jgi:hypothetical protein
MRRLTVAQSSLSLEPLARRRETPEHFPNPRSILEKSFALMLLSVRRNCCGFVFDLQYRCERSSRWTSSMQLSPVSLARLSILPLAPVQVAMFALYCRYYRLLPQSLVIGLPLRLLISVPMVAIIFIQAYIYRHITGFVVIDDWFLAMVVAIQVAVSLITGLLILRSRTGNWKPDERRT